MPRCEWVRPASRQFLGAMQQRGGARNGPVRLMSQSAQYGQIVIDLIFGAIDRHAHRLRLVQSLPCSYKNRASMCCAVRDGLALSLPALRAASREISNCICILQLCNE